MIRKVRLFTPGPTPLLPAAQFAMAAADLHHRTPEFRAMFLKVLAQLKDFVETRVVFMQATETSTGVRHCTPAVAKLLRDAGSEALLVVDAITGLGTSHLDMDAWGVDVLIGGSQKAVMIPPGLSYLAVSDRAWDRMEATYNPRYYFDLRKERKNAKNGESAYTPAVALIAALGAALDYIAGQAATPENPAGSLVQGRRMIIENAETIAAMPRAAVTALGFKLFAPECPAAAATAVLAPEGVDSGIICKELKTRFGATITNGQGEMKGKLFRIAHLGFFDYMDTIALIGALENVVQAKLSLPGFTWGKGLIAAQELYSTRAADAAAANPCFCGRTDTCCSLVHPDYGVTDIKPVH